MFSFVIPDKFFVATLDYNSALLSLCLFQGSVLWICVPFLVVLSLILLVFGQHNHLETFVKTP